MKKSWKLLLINFYSFIILCSSVVYGQNTDSLVLLFKQESSSVKQKLDILKKIKWATYGNTPEAGIKMLDQGIEFAEKSNDNLGLTHFYEGKAVLILRNGNISQAKDWYADALKYATKGGYDRNRFMIYIRLASLSAQQGDYEGQKKWLDKIDSDKEIKNFPGIRAMAISELGVMYFYMGKHRLSANQFAEAVRLQDELEDLPNLAFEQENLGRAYISLGMVDSGYYWYNQALKVYTQTKSKKGVASISFNLGKAYFDELKYDSAIKFLVQARNGFEEVGEIAGQGVATESIGMIFEEQGKPYKAIEHYKSAIVLLKESSTNFYLIEAYGSLAGVYKSIGKREECITYYLKAYEKAKEISGFQDMASMSNRLANLYLEEGNLIDSKKYLEISQSAVSQTDNQVIRAELYLSLAKFSEANGDTPSTLNYLDSVFSAAPSPNVSISAYKLKSKVYRNTGNLQLVIEAQDRMINIKDSVSDINDKKLEKEILAKYSLEKAEKELEIADLNSEKEKQQKIFGFALFGLALLALVLIIMRHRKYKKEKEESTRLKLESAQASINHSKEILQNQSQLILDKNRVITELKDNIESYFGEDSLKNEKMQHFLESKILTKEDWNSFKKSFSVVYPNFIAKTTAQFDKITESELRLLCLSKLGMDRAEIADMLGVLPRSVERTIHRFQKKYDLSSEDDLENIVK